MQATQGLEHASNLTQAISRDKFQLCHWPLVAYVALLALYALRCMRANTRLRCAFIASFAAHLWTSAVLDGRYIHKFIMPSLRTDSESADFFTWNLPKSTAYKILRTVTTLVIWPVKTVPSMTYNVFDGRLNLIPLQLRCCDNTITYCWGHLRMRELV